MTQRAVAAALVAVVTPVVLILSVTMLGTSHAQAEAAGAGVALQPAEIEDKQGFGQPVPAAVLQVPAGWRGQGGVRWNRGTHCSSNQVGLEWISSSADGLQTFEIMHGFNWQMQGAHIPTNPCPVLPFNSAQAFLREVVRQRRPGAEVLEFRNRPDLAQAAEQAAPKNPQLRRHHDAGQIFIAYRIGAQDFQEVLGTTLAFTDFSGHVMGGTGMVTAQRAPAGRLDVPLNDRIVSSIKPNPHWLAMAIESIGNAAQRFSNDQRRQIDAWHATEMARINAKGAADRAAIRAQSSRDVAAINAQTHANTQATNDRMHRRELEAIGEYSTYRDSSGTQVQSSIHGGDRVLRLPDGNYTSTRDPYYSPAGSEALKRVR